MTLSEWRALVDGYARSRSLRMREIAWSLSHQLVAAGCEAEKVTPAKLLGEKEPRRRREMAADEKFEKMWARAEKKRAAGKLKE